MMTFASAQANTASDALAEGSSEQASSEEFSQVAREVSSVTTLIGEISPASAEQAHGAEQINQAVTDMDRITSRPPPAPRNPHLLRQI